MTAEQQPPGSTRPADLTLLERTYLGVLDTGMVPSRLAGDPTLRMDHVTAVCYALRQDQPAATYLDGEGLEPSAAFLDELNAAALSLDARGVISVVAPPAEVLLSPELLTPEMAGASRPRPPARLDFDQRPQIRDKYLAHTCLEELFRDGRVYSFLMGKYQDSGDVWARLYKENPQRFL
jgi:hypothetical protein